MSILHYAEQSVVKLVLMAGISAAAYFLGTIEVSLSFVVVYFTMLVTLYQIWPELKDGGESKIKSTVFPNILWAFLWWWIVLVACTQVNGTPGKKDWMCGCVMIQSIVTLEAFKEYKHDIKEHEQVDGIIQAIENMAVHSVELVLQRLQFAVPVVLLAICIYFFAQSHVTPWGLPYILFVVPVVYVGYRAVNIRNTASPSLYITVMLFVTVLLFYPADFTQSDGIVPCPTNANAGKCGVDFTGVPLPNLKHCCCSEGFTPFGKWNRCSQCSTLNAKGKDCCGADINFQNEPFISGVTQCLCNKHANASNTYIEQQCICAEHYCGKSCAHFSHQACSKKVATSSFSDQCKDSTSAACVLKS